ncbi:hypothetical protein PVK06_017621 [Gossypium arboreum]|uniref:Uncharacterized protein n=1 Tax=Gossypium arboreum TaxID=29729 RepID=A0ABR0Q3W1_GOSAR|nr:hypothetical protein PVK06_017621 [Gossypium arboreum]
METKTTMKMKTMIETKTKTRVEMKIKTRVDIKMSMKVEVKMKKMRMMIKIKRRSRHHNFYAEILPITVSHHPAAHIWPDDVDDAGTAVNTRGLSGGQRLLWCSKGDAPFVVMTISLLKTH